MYRADDWTSRHWAGEIVSPSESQDTVNYNPDVLKTKIAADRKGFGGLIFRDIERIEL